MAGLCALTGPGHRYEDGGGGGGGGTPCQAGSAVMSQCYCPYQGYKTAAGQKLRCMQCVHHTQANITAHFALMDGSRRRLLKCLYSGPNNLLDSIKIPFRAPLNVRCIKAECRSPCCSNP